MEEIVLDLSALDHLIQSGENYAGAFKIECNTVIQSTSTVIFDIKNAQPGASVLAAVSQAETLLYQIRAEAKRIYYELKETQSKLKRYRVEAEETERENVGQVAPYQPSALPESAKPPEASKPPETPAPPESAKPPAVEKPDQAPPAEAESPHLPPKGTEPGYAYSPDPVNLATGNFVFAKNDITVPGAYPIVFKRCCNSTDVGGGVFGQSWRHSFELRLIDEKDRLRIVFGDGSEKVYTPLPNEDGCYTGEDGRAEKNADGGYTLTKTDGTRILWHSNGAARLVADANGNETLFDYDGDGQLCRVATKSGALTLAYARGRVVSVRDHTGRAVTYQYESGALTAVTAPGGGVYRYAYDERGRLVTIVNALGQPVVTNDYDDLNRTVKQTFPDGGAMAFRYTQNRVTDLFWQDGTKTRYRFDRYDRPVHMIHPDGEERAAYLNGSRRADKKTAYTDKNGHTHTYRYDGQGRFAGMIQPDAAQIAVAYAWQPNSATGQQNTTVTIERNNARRNRRKLWYDGKGNLLRAADAMGRVTSFEYDTHGLVRKTLLPNGGTRQFDYDPKGNLIMLVSAAGLVTHFAYDALNRVTARTDAAGQTTRYQYNAENVVTTVTDATRRNRTFAYNQAGQLQRVVDFDGTEVVFAYNDMRFLSGVSYAGSGAARIGFEYDTMWRLKRLTREEGGAAFVTRYDYANAPFGRVVSVTAPSGATTRYGCDGNGNVINITRPDRSVVTMRYDAMNRMTASVCDGSGNRFAYDESGRLKKIAPFTTRGDGQAATFYYNPAGALTGIGNESGNRLTFAYSSLGLLTAAADGYGTVALYDYDTDGGLTGVTAGDGRTATYASGTAPSDGLWLETVRTVAEKLSVVLGLGIPPAAPVFISGVKLLTGAFGQAGGVAGAKALVAAVTATVTAAATQGVPPNGQTATATATAFIAKNPVATAPLEETSVSAAISAKLAQVAAVSVTGISGEAVTQAVNTVFALSPTPSAGRIAELVGEAYGAAKEAALGQPPASAGKD